MHMGIIGSKQLTMEYGTNVVDTKYHMTQGRTGEGIPGMACAGPVQEPWEESNHNLKSLEHMHVNIDCIGDVTIGDVI
jgi:hypothetical protein